MPKTEDGEFELILGNRQLLSVFFIVVVLLGVFFTMGYIVGRNSGPTAGGDLASSRKADTKPLVVDAPSRAAEPAAPAPAAPAPRETAPQQPAVEVSKPSEPPKVVELPKTRAPEPPRAAPRPPAPQGQPAAGQLYLQLAATSQREADIMVDVLRRKAFKARTAEIPEKPGTFRVLVGPLEESSFNKTRADLQSAGFPGNAAIRRTY